MRCWNCEYNFSEGGRMCPNCRAALPPARSPVPELLLGAVVILAAGVGYVVGGWQGVANGVFAGVPLGLFAVAVLYQEKRS